MAPGRLSLWRMHETMHRMCFLLRVTGFVATIVVVQFPAFGRLLTPRPQAGQRHQGPEVTTVRLGCASSGAVLCLCSLFPEIFDFRKTARNDAPKSGARARTCSQSPWLSSTAVSWLRDVFDLNLARECGDVSLSSAAIRCISSRSVFGIRFAPRGALRSC